MAGKLMGWSKIRSHIARASGRGNLGPVFVGLFPLALRPKPAQNRPRKPGPGTGRTIEQPKVHPGPTCARDHMLAAASGGLRGPGLGQRGGALLKLLHQPPLLLAKRRRQQKLRRPIDERPYRRATLPKPYRFIGLEVASR